MIHLAQRSEMVVDRRCAGGGTRRGGTIVLTPQLVINDCTVGGERVGWGTPDSLGGMMVGVSQLTQDPCTEYQGCGPV